MMTTAPGTFWSLIASSTASSMDDSSPEDGPASLESTWLASVGEGPGTEGGTATAGTRTTQAKHARVTAPNASNNRFIRVFRDQRGPQARIEHLARALLDGKCRCAAMRAAVARVSG